MIRGALFEDADHEEENGSRTASDAADQGGLPSTVSLLPQGKQLKVVKCLCVWRIDIED